MVELVAIDLPQDDTMVEAIQRVWGRGDAVCVLDRRLRGLARERELKALAPTIVLDATGETRRQEGATLFEGDALCVMTSGSTADPKAAVLTMDAVVASARATSEALDVDPSRHRWLGCLPCAHIGGLSVVTRALVTETPLSMLERPTPEALALAAADGASHVSLVATVLQRIDPWLFELILLGGAAPPRDLTANVVTTYGMTETGSGVVYDGRALTGVEVAISQPDADGLGEILVRGPMLLRSYRDRPAPLVTGPDGRPGWFPTGDLGRIGPEGIVEVKGRASEVIVTGAEKVYPPDVEVVIAGLAGVAEAAVWKRPDPTWGERVVAWVVADGTPPTLEALRAVVSEEVAPYAAPKELVLVSSLPKTANGKVRRALLS